MKDPDGRWMQTPPSWPPIGHGHTLSDFVDPTDDTYGELLCEADFKPDSRRLVTGSKISRPQRTKQRFIDIF